MSDQSQDTLARQLLGCDYEGLTPIQRSVIDLIANEAPTEVRVEDDRSFGARLSDRVAAVGGSWGFIIGFAVILFGWIGWNAVTTRPLSFDPYPFIFLNLMLSTLAAIQAPIIMMSQNRAADRDRKAAEHDYTVNLRAELEIMHLHDKMDALREKEVVELLKTQGEAIRLLKARLIKG